MKLSLVNIFSILLIGVSFPGMLIGQKNLAIHNYQLGDGRVATKAQINGPNAIAIDGQGNLYIAEMFEPLIRKVNATTQVITTIAGTGKDESSGDGDLAINAGVDFPLALAIDRDGNIFFSEESGRIRRIDARSTIVSTVAGGNGHMGRAGTGDGGKAVNASFRRAYGLAFDQIGNLYIADDMDNRIRRIDMATGVIATVAGGGSSLGDGGPASSAQLSFPTGVVFDHSDNMFIADYQNCRIRRVDARTQIITTVAGNGINSSAGDGGSAVKASVNYPGRVAVDTDGNLYFFEGAKHRVRRVDGRSGVITTIAGTGKKGFRGDGGSASKAQLNNPSDIVIDGRRNIFIAEFVNNRVRRIDGKTNVITTVAGNGLPRRVDLML